MHWGGVPAAAEEVKPFHLPVHVFEFLIHVQKYRAGGISADVGIH